MKKIIALMFMVTLSLNAIAATCTVDGYTWSYSVSNGKAAITGVSPKQGGNLIIPAVVNGYTVTSIGNAAFVGCSGFTGSLTIPDSVTSIGNAAFVGCSGFTGSLTIPDCVTSIGYSAFNGCSGFTGSLTIPDSVTSIGYSAFNGCSGFTGSLTIGDSVTSIGNTAFVGCSGFTGSLTIGDSVTSIEDSAFYGWSAVKKVVFMGKPLSNVSNSYLYNYPCFTPREYGAQWLAVMGINRYYGSKSDAISLVDVVSSKIRENDPTIMDIEYLITSSKPTVKVRFLAFEDGERSFAKVVRPETFVDNTAPADWDAVPTGVTNKLSWRVSSDWTTKLAKVKFEVLAMSGELLPMELMTIPASDTYGKMKISWNALSDRQLFDTLMWLVASKDSALTYSSGVLKANGTTVAQNGGFSNNSQREAAAAFIFGKMGYLRLTGATLTYANSETRLGLSPSGARQYAYKIVE